MTAAEPMTGPKPLCGARRHQADGTCTLLAGWGTDHVGFGNCKLHGGATRNGRLAAFKAQVVVTGARRLGMALDVEPDEALMALIAEAASNVAVLRAEVSRLDHRPAENEDGDEEVREPAPGIYARTYHASGFATGEAKPHVLVAMYDSERDRLAKLAKDAIALGLKEREVRLAEQQGQLLADLFRSLIADPELGLSPAQQQMAPSLVRKHLALMRGAA